MLHKDVSGNPTDFTRTVFFAYVLALLPTVSSTAYANSPPVVSDFHLSTGDPIPTVGGTTEIGLEFLVTDVDGNANIAFVDYVLNPPSGGARPLDLISETTDVVDEYTLKYSISFGMEFYEEPGSYLVVANVFDGAGEVGTGSDSFVYEAILGLNVLEGSVQFGVLVPGQTSTPIPITIKNVGNIEIDIGASGADFEDGNGHLMLIQNLKISSMEFGVYTPVSDTLTIKNIDLLPGPSSLDSLYLRLEVPEIQMVGPYTGTISLFAVDSSLGTGPDPTLPISVTIYQPDYIFADSFENDAP